MHKAMQLISNILYNKNMPPSMKVHVHWMNLMKNQIIQKLQNFERKNYKVKYSFLKPLMGSKYLILNASHICK
jgi:hypothetical protein